MKRNLVGKILGKIKIFVQDFVPIRTALTNAFYFSEKSVRFLGNFLDLTRTYSDFSLKQIQTLVGDTENYTINKGGHLSLF